MFCLPLMLAACQTSGSYYIKDGLDVRPCLKIAETVDLPPIKAGTDARIVIARYRAALISANSNIEDTKACVALLNRAEKEGYF